MKKKAVSFILALLMVLSILPLSFAEEEVLGEVVDTDEVTEGVDEEALALSGGVFDFAQRLNDCRHEALAVKADEAGCVTAHDITVAGAAVNGAWMLSKESSLSVINGSKETVTSIILYFAKSVAGKLSKAAVEGALTASFSSQAEYSVLANCVVFNGSFTPETVIINSSEIDLPVIKVEVYTKEHFDGNKDSYCDICGADTYTVPVRTALNVSKTVDLFRRLSDSKKEADNDKTTNILGIVLGSVYTLFSAIKTLQ